VGARCCGTLLTIKARRVFMFFFLILLSHFVLSHYVSFSFSFSFFFFVIFFVLFFFTVFVIAIVFVLV
jgi:hypothetical protein